MKAIRLVLPFIFCMIPKSSYAQIGGRCSCGSPKDIDYSFKGARLNGNTNPADLFKGPPSPIREDLKHFVEQVKSTCQPPSGKPNRFPPNMPKIEQPYYKAGNRLAKQLMKKGYSFETYKKQVNESNQSFQRNFYDQRYSKQGMWGSLDGFAEFTGGQYHQGVHLAANIDIDQYKLTKDAALYPQLSAKQKQIESILSGISPQTISNNPDLVFLAAIDANGGNDINLPNAMATLAAITLQRNLVAKAEATRLKIKGHPMAARDQVYGDEIGYWTPSMATDNFERVSSENIAGGGYHFYGAIAMDMAGNYDFGLNFLLPGWELGPPSWLVDSHSRKSKRPSLFGIGPDFDDYDRLNQSLAFNRGLLDGLSKSCICD